MNETTKLYRNLAIIGVSGVLLILVIFLGIIPLINRLNRPAYLDILVAPYDATVTINDAEYHSATYELTPGNYKATISKPGFLSKEVDLTLNQAATTGLYLYLVPEDNNWNFYEQSKNQASLQNLLRINGYNINGQKTDSGVSPTDDDHSADNLIKKYSIKSIMPVNISICQEPASRMTCNALKINYDYSEKCNNLLCLIIEGRGGELNEAALSSIRANLSENDYNLADYKYIYRQNTEL